ncbi:MAG: hypothetical protein V2L15_09060, partial [Desulfobacteraceae bacterium]|nr:hypothetical protein [Desulfobacteraceae bacterium]
GSIHPEKQTGCPTHKGLIAPIPTGTIRQAQRTPPWGRHVGFQKQGCFLVVVGFAGTRFLHAQVCQKGDSLSIIALPRP